MHESENEEMSCALCQLPKLFALNTIMRNSNLPIIIHVQLQETKCKMDLAWQTFRHERLHYHILTLKAQAKTFNKILSTHKASVATDTMGMKDKRLCKQCIKKTYH